MKNLQVRIKTDLTTEPVSLAEAKNFCKVTGSQDESLITILITSARQALEKYTQSSFAAKTIHATWVTPPEDDEYELPYGPHIAVSKVYRIDEEGTETELTLNIDYWVFGDQDFVLKINRSWSSNKHLNSVRVEYTAGYGDTNTETLPSVLKEAIMKEVATNYELRENFVVGAGVSELSNDAKRKAAPYRKMIWF